MAVPAPAVITTDDKGAVLGRADAALGLLLMVFVANPLLSAACERPAHRRARRQPPRRVRLGAGA
jgi:hypothetical protein